MVANAVCATYRAKCAETCGGAANGAAKSKVERLDSVSKDDFFMPLAFESEGYSAPSISALLFGFAKHRLFHDGLDEDTSLLHRLHSNYMDAIASAHARGLARCLLERGMSNFDAIAGYNRTFHPSDCSDSSEHNRHKRRRIGDYNKGNCAAEGQC